MNARRITIAVGLTMLVESTLYQAVVPLLPSYADRFDLSKTGAGIVLAAYPLPTPIIGLLAGFLTPRIGGRRMALAGSPLLTIATLAFAVAPNVLVLDLARGLQGCAAGITWAASMAWLSANTPRERIARESGIVMGLFSTGAVIGPGVGSFAHATSPGLAFTCLAGAAALTIPLAWRAPAGVRIAAERATSGRSARSSATGSCWPRSCSRSSIPSRSARSTCSSRATCTATACRRGTSARRSWPARRSARSQARSRAAGPTASGRCASASSPPTALVLLPTVLIFGLSDPAQLLLLVAVAPAFTIMATAMYPLSTSGADARGVSHGVVNGVLSVTWATAFAVGSLASGVLADRHGDTATYASSRRSARRCSRRSR